ncbi:MAG TPA: hypothetical protein VF749_02995 [Candidatus Acidoferrum sp.]
MVVLRYALMILGLALFGSASALAAYDIFLATELRRLLRRDSPRPHAWAVTYKEEFPGSTAGPGLR